VAFDLIATALVTILLVVWLKERVLLVLFPWAYVQNVVLASMYTSGIAGRDACRALLVSKEFILLWLFIYFFPRLGRNGRRRWLAPLGILVLFTMWCIGRYMLAVIFQGESLFNSLWNLRIVLFPLEILTVAVGVASTKPEFALRFIRGMVYLASALAVVGILLYLLPGSGFWRAYADIATYQLDVKGQSPGYTGEPAEKAAEEEGISANGLARPGFSFISPFRAFGTIGDAVGFGHFLAFPALLLAFAFPRGWRTRSMLAMTLGALFFSFTRSAWMFVVLGCVYILMRNRRYRLLLAFAAAVAMLLIWAPIGDWYSESVAALSWGNAQDYHGEGLVWLYKEGLWRLDNVLGRGLSIPGDLPESGYGVLLLWYGLPSIVGIVWFCLSTYRTLRGIRNDKEPLLLVAQAVPVVLLLILNFSYYPFSFIPYLLPWFVVGTCLATGVTKGADAGGIGHTAKWAKG